MVEVIAFLHQHPRPRKLHEGVEYLDATVADYAWAYFLAHKVLRNSLDELSRWGRELLTFFEREKPSWITRRELREGLGWPDRRLREALEELTDQEYLEVQRGANNLYSFQLAAASSGPSRISIGLMTPEELARQWHETP